MKALQQKKMYLIKLGKCLSWIVAFGLFSHTANAISEQPPRLFTALTLSESVPPNAGFIFPPKDSVDKETYIARAMWKSLMVPGWGQWQNKHYWKIPIIYGAYAGAIYSLQFAASEYRVYRDAYNIRVDGNDDTQDPFDGSVEGNPSLTNQQLQRTRDFHRRNRDLSVIILVGIHAINVLDAYVAAHLKEFDVSDDLSMRIKPISFLYNGRNTATVGLNLKLKL